MTNYNHLNQEQRDTIQFLLNYNFSFTYIGNAIKVDRTTVAKEIKRNRYVKHPFYLPFSFSGIQKTINICDKLSKPPYVCNGCKFKSSCTNPHLYYNSKEAHKHYEETLISTRQGYNITNDELMLIEKNIVPLIKNKKQSVNQVFINHPDILYFSKTTFYKYVNEKLLSLSNIDLPRKVRYKARRNRKSTENKRDFAILIGRRYEDYLQRINNNSKATVWQLDTVIGKQDEQKCLMTFMLVETNFMIIRLLDKKNIQSVDDAFTKIKNNLGSSYYKYVNIILTDNGSEFYDPIHMEYDLDSGEKLSSVYYCHPNSPHEKSELEKNHEYIRNVFPKGSSFEKLTEFQVKKLEDNINNVPREILGNETPYNLTKKLYPGLVEKFNSKFIKPDDVSLFEDDILN